MDVANKKIRVVKRSFFKTDDLIDEGYFTSS
jgi:hypothetical protein